MTLSASDTHARNRSRATTTLIVSLIAWGLLHVVGGAALIAAAVGDGARAGLEAIGTGAPSKIASDPGSVAGALVGFHGLNIVFAGAAVTLITWRRTRRRHLDGAMASLAVVTAADIGLIAFLLIPGYMRVTDGIWGPALLVVAGVAYLMERRKVPTVGADGTRTD